MRDYFAAQFLAGRSAIPRHVDFDLDAKMAYKMAYKMADAMLRVRQSK